MGAAVSSRSISLDELIKHDGYSQDPWIALDGKVYDVSKYLYHHPGGHSVIRANAGKDCTENFQSIGHSESAIEQLGTLFIGILVITSSSKGASASSTSTTTPTSSAKSSTPTPAVIQRSSQPIPLKEVALHDSNAMEQWIIINKKVYNITSFLNDHPGGANALLKYAGRDCTQEFNKNIDHKFGNAASKLNQYLIGDLESDVESDLVAFSPNVFREFEITQIDILSHNTKKYRVALPTPNHSMGAITASYVFIRGGDTQKPYTPISLDSDKGFMDLVIKTYPNGKVSCHMDSLKVGDKLEVKGAFKKLEYKTNMKKAMGFIAGGTGITPMLQIIQESLRRSDDTTQMTLIFANSTEKDILLKSFIDDLASKCDRVKVIYVCSRIEDQAAWEASGGYVGHINEDILRAHLPHPSLDSMIFSCGPPAFMEAVSGTKAPDYSQGSVAGILQTLGYSSEMVFKF